jgi:HK97 family phage major capsid protein
MSINIPAAQQRLKELAAEMVGMPYVKGLTEPQKHQRLDQLEQDFNDTETAIKNHRRAMSIRAGNELGPNDERNYMNQLNGGTTMTIPTDVRSLGRAPALAFDDSDARGMFAAMKAGANCKISSKGFTGDIHTKTGGVGAGTLLPAQLAPQITAWVHEWRILERLPALASSAPSYEFIRHSSTTGTPAIVEQAAVKPEVTLGLDTVVATAVKIACHSALSWETLQDYDRFLQYLQVEIPKQVIEVENHQLLYGAGSGSGEILGLAHTPNILVHHAGDDSGTNVTALDSVEIGIEQLRSGPALAVPNLFITSPSSWSAMRRLKTTYGQFLVAPDPTSQEANSLWGVPVLTTTAVSPGDAFLVDTSKFGAAIIRESISLRQGTNADDFTRNLLRWVCEERLALAVERPQAVLQLTGLPTTTVPGS